MKVPSVNKEIVQNNKFQYLLKLCQQGYYNDRCQNNFKMYFVLSFSHT